MVQTKITSNLILVVQEKLFKAVQRGNVREVESLIRLRNVDVNSKHELGWSPLHLAAVNGRQEVCQTWYHLPPHTTLAQIASLLISAGADVNAEEEFQNVYNTAREKRKHSLEVQIAREDEFCRRVSPRANFRGCTALHYAVLADNIGVINTLLEAGADPLKANDRGHTPSDYAKDEGTKQLIKKYAEKYERNKRKLEIEERKKFPLEKRLKEFIVGQEGPITTVASAIRRKENGWIDEEHPLVFLFLGSSGIGKTELAKQVSRSVL